MKFYMDLQVLFSESLKKLRECVIFLVALTKVQPR